jgi:hypothetical protein
MTFASPLVRNDPPDVSSELTMLNSWLDYERATLLGKLSGLTDEQIGQWWFVECVAGLKEPYAYYASYASSSTASLASDPSSGPFRTDGAVKKLRRKP